MKSRRWKWTALLACGGLLFQLGGGCVALIADLAIQQLPTLFLAILSALLQGAAGTA